MSLITLRSRRWAHPAATLLIACGLAVGTSACGSDDAASTAARASSPPAAASSTPGTPESPAVDPPTTAPSKPLTSSNIKGVSETAKLYAGIPQSGTTLGSQQAPVIVEFVDLQCPFCAKHEREHQAQIINELVRPGKAQLFVVPLAFLGPDSKTAQTVFARLAIRNLGFPFMHLMYLNQGRENSGYVTKSYLERLLAHVPGAVASDADPTPSAEVTALVQTYEKLGRAAFSRAGGGGTPYFMVGAPGAAVSALHPVSEAKGKVTAEVLAETILALPKAKSGGQVS